jgi:hypothetical protein
MKNGRCRYSLSVTEMGQQEKFDQTAGACLDFLVLGTVRPTPIVALVAPRPVLLPRPPLALPAFELSFFLKVVTVGTIAVMLSSWRKRATFPTQIAFQHEGKGRDDGKLSETHSRSLVHENHVLCAQPSNFRDQLSFGQDVERADY